MTHHYRPQAHDHVPADALRVVFKVYAQCVDAWNIDPAPTVRFVVESDKPRPGGLSTEQPICGCHQLPGDTVFINVGAHRTPCELARTTAHELRHVWQARRHGWKDGSPALLTPYLEADADAAADEVLNTLRF